MIKLLYIFSALFYAFMLYFGFESLEADRLLFDQFMEVGWENYNGPDLDSPENRYYGIWVLGSIGTLFLLGVSHWMGYTKGKMEKNALGFTMFFLVVYFILYCMDGDASIKETKILWFFSSSVQALIFITISFGDLILNNVNLFLKYLYGVCAIGYVGLLFLGYYYLNWDNEILAEIERVGSENYRGPDKDDPENNYHLILLFATAGSILLAVWGDKKKKALVGFEWIVGIFFLYSLFVYVNDGNPNMTETKTWWTVLSTLSCVVSAILFLNTKSNLPEKEVIYEDNLLDDFSNLE